MPALYRIGAVARLTGISPDVIRVWERRYRVVEPVRDEKSGLRLYSDDHVSRLQRIRRATEAGHAIGRVAAMSDDELERLAGTGLAAHREERSATQMAVSRIVLAIRAGDAAAAEQALASASMQFDARVLALDVLAPALRRAGKMWEEGTLSVWQEHLLSSLVRIVTGSLMRTLPRTSAGSMLFATPPYELHEFGVSLASLIAAAHGRPTHNLGANVPVSEIASAVRRLRPVAVVIGMTREDEALANAHAFARQIDEAIPRRIALWFGGPNGPAVAQSLSSQRARGVPTLELFDKQLDSLANGA